MVHQPSKSSSLVIIIPIALISAIVITFTALSLLSPLTKKVTEEEPTETIETTTEPQNVEPEPEVVVDFQAVVDSWVKETLTGDAGVIIYDIDKNLSLAEYQADDAFYTASIYKLFVVYEGYRRIEQGTYSRDTIVSGNYNRLKCLDLAIRESYSPCAEAMWAEIGHATLDDIIKNDYNITNSGISTLWSTPRDVAKIMQRFWEHPDFSTELWELAADSMLNQPKTTYDWRRGLPAGFSSDAKVYNKVGWNWTGSRWSIYADAAIVEFPEYNKHYIVVAMTHNIANSDELVDLGRRIETAVKGAYSPESR